MQSEFYAWSPDRGAGLPPCKLVLVVRGTVKLLAMKEAYTLLVEASTSVSRQCFVDNLQAASCRRASPMKQVSPQEARVLRQHGCYDATSARARLVTATLVHRALSRLQALPPQLAASFKELFATGYKHLPRLSPHQTKHPAGEGGSQQGQAPSMPTQLPVLNLPAAELNVARYGLKSIAPALLDSLPLQEELANLR